MSGDDPRPSAAAGGTRKAADFFIVPGAYRCADAGLSALVLEQNGEALLQLHGPSGAAGYRLSALGPGLCLASARDGQVPPGAILEFDRLGFRLSAPAGGALRFLRAPSAGRTAARPQ